MKKIVFLTGAGMSAESGLSTFRDSGGLWDKYPVEEVASHDGWERNPDLVTEFYNIRRRELVKANPNEGHLLIARMEEGYDVTIVTQNVDNLHEAAGSTNVIHLHGELMKVCSSRDPYHPKYIRTLSPENCEVRPGTLAGDGSLLRPYIVFFGEAVPMINIAAEKVAQADLLVVIGTSLNVYPAAGLVRHTAPGTPVFIIDPKPVNTTGIGQVRHIMKGASEGMKELVGILKELA